MEANGFPESNIRIAFSAQGLHQSFTLVNSGFMSKGEQAGVRTQDILA